MSFIMSVIFFSLVNEHVAYEDTFSVARNNTQATNFGCSCGVLQTAHTGKIRHFCSCESVLAMCAWHFIAAAAHCPKKARY